MLWPALFFAVSLAGLGIASYTDLKKRIVNNWLSYSLIIIGLAGHFIWAAIESNPMIFVFSAVSAAGGFGFAWLLWKIGVWAGGDVKLFTGLAALNPTNLFILGLMWAPFGGLSAPVQLPIFPISLFIFSVFAMLPYGSLISAHGIWKRKEERSKLWADAKQRAVHTFQLSLAIVGFSWILTSFGITTWALLPILIVFGLIKNGKARTIVAVVLFAWATYNAAAESVSQFVLLFVLFFGLYLLIKLYSVSKTILREKKKIINLEEGDIPAETLMEQEGIVKKIQPLGIKKIINYLTNNRVQELQGLLQPSGRVIISSNRARGLSDEELEELRTLAKENKIGDTMEVKLSAPFVPALLIAYLALNIVGDIIWALVF